MQPFAMSGPTILVPGATTAPLGVQAKSDGTDSKKRQYRLHNAGSVSADVAHGATDTAARDAAVAPTAGNPRRVFRLPAGAIEILSAPANAYWSAKTATGTADIFITPGEGV